MAKTSFIDIPDGLEVFFAKALTSSDRFQFPSIRRKPLFATRKKIAALTQKSVMPQAKIAWANLTSEQKIAWVNASAFGYASGWQLFLIDYADRLKNSLSVPGIPNLIFQDKVGHIEIVSPASTIKLEQVHPLTYWVQRKVTGTRNQYVPRQIIESFVLPLSIGISWKTSLVAVGPAPFAKFYAVVLSHYQGRNILTNCEINFGLADDWIKATASLSSVIGLVVGYSVFIEAGDVTGEIFFDDVIISHSDQNWARDPKCNSVAVEFTKAFAQIPRHWAPVDLPVGTYYESIYYSYVPAIFTRYLPFGLGLSTDKLYRYLPFNLGEV